MSIDASSQRIQRTLVNLWIAQTIDIDRHEMQLQLVVGRGEFSAGIR